MMEYCDLPGCPGAWQDEACVRCDPRPLDTALALCDNPSMKNKPNKPKLGPSAVAVAARLGRPGGTHDRRKKPRADAQRRAINDSKEG